MRKRTILLVTFTLVCLSGIRGEADDKGPCRRRPNLRSRAARPAYSPAYSPADPRARTYRNSYANPYANPYFDTEFWYPKYYGGFHYRSLHNYGDAPGYELYRFGAW